MTCLCCTSGWSGDLYRCWRMPRDLMYACIHIWKCNCTYIKRKLQYTRRHKVNFKAAFYDYMSPFVESVISSVWLPLVGNIEPPVKWTCYIDDLMHKRLRPVHWQGGYASFPLRHRCMEYIYHSARYLHVLYFSTVYWSVLYCASVLTENIVLSERNVQNIELKHHLFHFFKDEYASKRILSIFFQNERD